MQNAAGSEAQSPPPAIHFLWKSPPPEGPSASRTAPLAGSKHLNTGAMGSTLSPDVCPVHSLLKINLELDPDTEEGAVDIIVWTTCCPWP